MIKKFLSVLLCIFLVSGCLFTSACGGNNANLDTGSEQTESDKDSSENSTPDTNDVMFPAEEADEDATLLSFTRAATSAFYIVGGDYPLEINGTKDDNEISAINALAAREVYGKIPEPFEFNANEKLTRANLAKYSVCLYAALKGIGEETVEPGRIDDFDDLKTIPVFKRWYVHIANTMKFIETEGNNFRPNEIAKNKDVSLALEQIGRITRVRKAPDYEGYMDLVEKNFVTMPTISAPPAKKVDLINITKTEPKGEVLAAVSIQGIVNRQKPTLYTLNCSGHNYKWMIDYILSKNPSSSLGETFTEYLPLLRKYKNYIKGAVVYDDTKLWTIDIATMIAGLKDYIIISKNEVDAVKELGITNFEMLSETFGSMKMHEGTRYCYENYSEYLRRDAVNYMHHIYTHDWERDYAIQMKLPCIWVPGYYEANAEQQIAVTTILQRMPANIACFGFQDANYKGHQVGLAEVPGNKYVANLGKYTSVTDWAANFSFHSGVKVTANKLRYKSKNEKKVYDPNKKYVSLQMIESSDSPGYMAYNFQGMQWNATSRGNKDIPFSYALGMTCYDLIPTYLEYFYENLKPGDDFFAGFSGLGYFYPFIEKYDAAGKPQSGFGVIPLYNDDEKPYTTRETIMKDHYTKTNWMMKKMGYNSLSLVAHGGAHLLPQDLEDIKNLMAPYVPECKMFFAGMGRHCGIKQLPYLYANVGENQTVFHSLFMWARGKRGNEGSLDFNYNPEGYQNAVNSTVSGNPKLNIGLPYDEAKDGAAINYMYNEITRHTNPENAPELFKACPMKFYAGLCYSWNYGARRLKLVYDEIEKQHPGEYEFVTTSQFVDLWVQANSQNN